MIFGALELANDKIIYTLECFSNTGELAATYATAQAHYLFEGSK